MDELELLRGVRGEVPVATPEDLSRSRARLSKEIEGARAARYVLVRVPARRVVWLTAAGLAAVLALAVLGALDLFAAVGGGPAAGGRVGTGPGSGGAGSGGPSSGAQPSDRPAASLGAAVAGREASTTVTGAEALQIVDQAAMVALRRPALSIRPDQFVFIDTFVQNPVGTGGTWLEEQSWLSVDGTHDGLHRQGEVGTDSWDSSPVRLCHQPPPGPDGKPRPAICFSNPAYHADLPTTGDGMLRYLTQLAQERRPGVTPYTGLLLTIAVEILENEYLPPASLSAMFDALKAIPELSVGMDAVDELGRPGLSINFDTPGGDSRVELMFDARTFEYHGVRTVYLKDLNNRKKGDIDNQKVRRRLAIVDRVGQLP